LKEEFQRETAAHTFSVTTDEDDDFLTNLVPDAFKYYNQEGRARNLTFGVKKVKNE
jgi:hypothetical protein